MTTLDDLVREVRSSLRGYGLIRDRVSFLNGGLNSVDLTFTVDDGTLINPGIVEIGDECIYVQSVASNVATVAPDGRGWDGTTPAVHADNARVTSDPPYPTWRIEQAINDTIVGTWPTLWGVASTTFTFNPAISTYSLPADCERVLSVSTTVLGPSLDQHPIRKFSFDSNSNTTEFATTNSITLHECPEPGRTVTVTYAKAPAAIASGDALTDSGLRESARKCVVYGAVAHLLSYVDAARALAGSAANHEMSEATRIGSASQLSAQLTARYQMELGMEQSRLREAHPAIIRWGR